MKVSSSTASFPLTRPRVLLGAVVVLLLLAFGLRIWRIDGGYEHFDEVIAVKMSQRLEDTPGWDNNWKPAGIPNFSYVDQYNFSAYLYGTHLFRRAAEAVTHSAWLRARDGLVAHRLFSALCATVAVGFVMLAARRLGGDPLMLVAGLLAALNPQLVQEAHYARPEAFMTLLAAILLWLALRSPVTERALGAMAFLVGLLVATKVGNGLFLIVPLLAVGRRWRELRSVVRPVAIIGLGFAAGWALGVPYAIVHGEQYLAGIESLSGQYAGSHPPHSLPTHEPVWPLLRAYFAATHGVPLLLAMGVGIVFGGWKKNLTTGALLVLPLLGTICLFGSQRVFFERNLSMIIPAGLLLAGLGFEVLLRPWFAQGPGRTVALLAAALLASITGDRVVFLLSREGFTDAEKARRSAFVQEVRERYPGVRDTFGSFFEEGDLSWLRTEVELGKGELLLFVWDFNDAYKDRWMPVIADRFQLVPVAEYHGAFADYPTSTLTVTHGARVRAYIVRARTS